MDEEGRAAAEGTPHHHARWWPYLKAPPAADARYILYLVPEGRLYDLLERYYEDTLAVCRNDAHDYLPHCTLTGFFSLPAAYPLRRLTSVLQHVLHEAEANVEAAVCVERLYDDTAIGLAVHAPALVAAVSRWAEETSTDSEGTVSIRPKTRLHISMAYGVGVARADTPLLYSRALELDKERKAIALAERPLWKVVLLEQKADQKRQPRLWMYRPLWSWVLSPQT
jgi:hypothetical protein